MIFLGINIGHNASAALMKDGKIIFALQEERFTNIKNFRCDFMTMTFDTNKNNLKRIHAGCHRYDHTVRPQILEKKFNPMYYSIIKKFYALTGIPALLNTSLNLHGYPVASSL